MASTVTSGTSKTSPPPDSSRPGYGRLLRTRGAWTFLLPGFAARQPFAMLTISIVLLVQHTTGSYGAAGAVAAATGVSMALFAPYSGRLADRHGQRAILLPGVLVHTLAGLSLTALALTGAPLWALFAAAVPTGASVPQVGPMVRARWGVKLQDSPLMTTAAAFESVTDELTFVLGPLLATALCTAVNPAAGLLTEATLTLVGGLLFAAQKSTQPAVAPDRHARVEHASALRVPGVRVLIVTFLGIGSVFGGMQVSLAAFSESIGEPGLNGVLYGTFAAGNMLSGIVCGAIAWKIAPQRRLVIGYAALALAASGLWTAHSVVVLAGIGLLVGMCIAPALITGYTLVEDLVPATARTEAFTWLTGAVALGQAAAVTVAGQLEDRLWDGAGFLVPMAGTVLALATLVCLRSRLAHRPAGRTVARGVGHRVPVTVD
ncbi:MULTISPECIES: MFS transporter [Streptomyces]|uniref:ABC transporter permease protein n=2 Tax=Streptomyces avermitilis TaxID=33903 RepID=Q82H69_STRAW|nr:MFS transporter [Streptomyces avermitilis]MYS99269.1 MFS transporter [Streptomyces sp. SID5469]KUN56824.1 ABC transporter [Streptomyces avermitilis]OOV32447.1 MFS transporter [Streptomyces avermitilis]BAC71389.1 putative ABC transporter permease protein [Streptomyces avermitilis MA-4680 = NBRC 14893]BBJ51588.1 MFS transporter [Streptomyces avermitilis]